MAGGDGGSGGGGREGSQCVAGHCLAQALTMIAYQNFDDVRA